MNALLWNRTAIAWDIATDLVPLAKQQSRIYHDRDDVLVEQYVRQALSVVETRANINLAAATFESVGAVVRALGAACCWWPQWSSWGYLLPFNNVRAVRLFDSAGIDVSGSTEVVQQKYGSNAEAYLVMPSGASTPTLPGASIEIDCGVDDKDDIDPAVLAVVLRMAAAYYEHREADQPLTDTVFVASRFESEIASIWRPTA